MTTRNRFFEAKGNRELTPDEIIKSFSRYVAKHRYTITQEEVARRAHIMLTRLAELAEEQCSLYRC